MIQIPFHPRFTEQIRDGRKTFTLRLDPGYDPDPGDPLTLVDGDRETIAGVICTLNAQVPAGWIPHWKFLGHREYEDLDALKEELAEYYPDHDVDPDTPITVIGWR